MAAIPEGNKSRLDSPTNDKNTSPSISVDEYRRLPRPLRAEFDRWLADEGLKGQHLTWFRLLEGAIEAEQYATDSDGHLVVQGRDELVIERRIYRIRTAPPREALSA